MKIPSYIYLLLFTVLLALGCSTVAKLVDPYLNDTVAVRVLVGTLLFVPFYKVLLSWHRAAWEAQNAR